VGSVADTSNYDLYVNGILQNRSTVFQDKVGDPNKAWVAKDLFVSTFGGLSNLSSMLVGSANFIYPLLQTNGILVAGSGGGSGPGYLYSASNQSTIYTPTQTSFSIEARKVRIGPNNTWVAVGRGSGALQALYYSPNGYLWLPAASGGYFLGGRDVVYGGGVWVSVGYSSGGTTTIQYSANGLTWNNCAGSVFPTGVATGGNAVAYNGSNLFVAAGVDSVMGGQFGLRYSSDGVTWSVATLTGGPAPAINFLSVGYGNGRWLASATVGSFLYSSSNGTQWFQIPGSPPTFRTFAYIDSASVWLGGGDAVAANPLTTIQFSPTYGSNWLPISQGGFTGGCYDILSIPPLSTFVAAGSNSVATDLNVQYSANYTNWSNSPSFFGSAFGVGYGALSLPNTQPFFTGNMTSIFRSTLSSANIIASTINASSFTGNYSADGSLLTKVGLYTSSIFTSTATATVIRAQDISASLFLGSNVRVADSITVNRITFLSSANIILATGSDSQSNGNIQTSADGQNWIRALDTNFEYYGNDITGNSNVGNPFYVAAGADSRTLYTLN